MSQNSDMMGYSVKDVGSLTSAERSKLFDVLYVVGGYVFVPRFIGRTQLYVWPVMLFAVLSFCFWIGGAVVSIIVVVGEVNINLSAFLMTTVIFTAVVTFVAFGLTVMEFSRKNNDLSIWHKQRIFMPLVVTVLMSFMAIICLAVHNKIDGTKINRHDVNEYTALAFCMMLIYFTPILIGRELIPAVISTIYPECEAPEVITLAPDRAARLVDDYRRYQNVNFGKQEE